MELYGKGVFLTGGARGLGRGMTEALLSKGAKVLFCDILTDAGKSAEAELQAKYGADNFGAVDICVNNAGIMDERVLERMVAVNMVAKIRGSQLALDHMRRDRGGRGGLIINMVSTTGVLDFLENLYQYTLSILHVFSVSDVVEAFMKMVLDQDSTDVIFEVTKPEKGAFRKRRIVDSDGESNPVMVD
ncbi:hypothetical protein BaRGS_00037548 [Batillaria attramentaria]|uniref:15-hydroxyprostaglandin dehydrogenase [NAD(+)] n=1 Tax=Batillaria attramentaria TaxID=370345 RepID=A0ABD0J8G1_9CAEN